MNKTKKLALIALGLAMLNLLILDGIIDNTCRIHHQIHCEYDLVSEARVCH